MTCPEPTAIAELVEGRLSPDETAGLEGHLDSCSRCAELVAAAVSTLGSTTVAVPGNGSPLTAGTLLGRYEVRRWIGRGGMGDVHEGWDPELERRVAIKVLRDWGDDRASAQRRLSREAKTLARLSSPHVVAALDVGLAGDRLFLVMELVEGPNLAEWAPRCPAHLAPDPGRLPRCRRRPGRRPRRGRHPRRLQTAERAHGTRWQGSGGRFRPSPNR